MAGEIDYKIQYRRSTFQSGYGDWVDVPGSGILYVTDGTCELRIVAKPLPCTTLSNFTVEGNNLRCERMEHINDGRHRHDYDHSEHDMGGEDCYHTIEW